MLGKIVTGLVGLTVGAEIVKDAVRETSRNEIYSIPVQTPPQYHRGGQPILNGAYSGGLTTRPRALKERLEDEFRNLGLRYDASESVAMSGDHTRLYYYGAGYRVRVKVWESGRVEVRVQTRSERTLGEGSGYIRNGHIELNSIHVYTKYRYGMERQTADVETILNVAERA